MTKSRSFYAKTARGRSAGRQSTDQITECDYQLRRQRDLL
ncbi:hypothetical protein C4K13_4827 [Pseudomonas chlororaphis subsp. aureofaciens]|nr:hypothetical protein C4K13_4827 [Pseudomonas chlororaphis subsp. aureofaciens]AZE25146.1 hypothetical protein C4K08_4737 [Pseudomonas chlororaphis subsp. aureofaciens]